MFTSCGDRMEVAGEFVTRSIWKRKRPGLPVEGELRKAGELKALEKTVNPSFP